MANGHAVQFHDAEVEADQLDAMLESLMRDVGTAGATPSRVVEGRLPRNAKGDAFTVGAIAVAALPRGASPADSARQ